MCHLRFVVNHLVSTQPNGKYDTITKNAANLMNQSVTVGF